MKRKHFLLPLFLALVMLLLSFPVVADGVDTATFKVGSTTVASTEIVDGSVQLPPVPAIATGFVGWTATVNGNTVFLPAGARCTGLSGDVTFEAVTVSFVTDEGGTVRLKDDDVALRFTSTMSRADYENLVRLTGDRAKVAFGTYIVPATYVAEAGQTFTLEALRTLGYTQYIDVPATNFYRTTATTCTVAGSVGQILPGNYTMVYTGVGYLKVTYDDGSVGTVYAEYNYNKNSCSITRTVLSAYNDRDPSYDNLIIESTGSTHSPYTDLQLQLCREFLDQIVMVMHDSSYNYIPYVKGYYATPWGVTYSKDQYERNVIVCTPPLGMTAADAKGIFLDGVVIPMKRSRIENGKVVFERSNYVSGNIE